MVRITHLAKRIYPELTWSLPGNDKQVYLTFDDGPTPGVTNWVMDLLNEYQVKATFFCLGKNVRQYPELYHRILSEGHAVGNHTYDHKKGWNTSNYDYLKNVLKCAKYVDSNLFRPPYGRIKKAQIKSIKKQYNIIMWDVLSEDYRVSITAEACLKNVVDQTKEGSIIVFHDSKKASNILKQVLPKTLEYLSEKGFKPLPISI